MASSLTNNEVSEQVAIDSIQVEANTTQESQEHEHEQEPESVVGRKGRKTSSIWKDFDEVEIKKGVMKGVCKYCKLQFSTGGRGSSTSHMKMHIDKFLKKKLHESTEKRQTTILFQPSNSGNPFITPGARYSNEKMWEIIATAIMVHEYPFSIVEDDIWMWGFQYVNSDFHKVTHKPIRSDCVALFEREKKVLKKNLESMGKISLTTDMWKSSHQVVEYMVITGHFIDSEWNLQKRVLSFVKVLAPRRGIDVADSIYKCLKTWGIENKVFSVSVDNASYNDSCLRCLKDDLSLTSKLILDGSLFHVRCCAHILNFLVQDGLSKIKDIIFNIRESVKYINHNDGILKAFCDVVEQKAFKEREPHYDYAPLPEEWNKVEKVSKLLEVFNRATHVISGSEYPTANLYLSDDWKVKEIVDKAGEDEDLFTREMASPMKIKFDEYWGECNMLMAIASVLDPSCKFHMVHICFPKIYKSKEVADENIMKVRCSLEDLYDEYVALSLAESSSSVVNLDTNNTSSSQVNVVAVRTGFDEIVSIIQESEAISPIKSKLQDYLDEGIYIPKSAFFCALDWWRNNSMKYKILSKMAADILAISISTVASKSTFSVGGRVIDEHRSKLNEESVEALICGGDWFRHKYNVKKKSKMAANYKPVKVDRAKDKSDVKMDTANLKLDAKFQIAANDKPVKVDSAKDKSDVKMDYANLNSDAKFQMAANDKPVKTAANDKPVKVDPAKDKSDVKMDPANLNLDASMAPNDKPVKVDPAKDKSDVKMDPANLKLDAKFQIAANDKPVKVDPAKDKSDVKMDPANLNSDASVVPIN
ncbi:zinc finger BED domain-containing protein RICESLEEPER 2-like [Vicia villosa]|uniref:zinc finger BED domain-containing protein RICESLEEPER 2-like n=1 Tax=Vicia villosa TaxID=3911 RepID=UPI00273AD133|nr:zinc finger BED domain-containing protein RICESLEEPER 2-like [Vicia villosa]